MTHRWIVRPMDGGALRHLAGEAGVSALLARLLIQRGVTTLSQVRDFLCADLSDLASPGLLPDCEKGVAIVRRTLGQHQKIRIVGDYDVDGLTSTALLVRALKGLKATVSWHIPHRMNDGYGLKSSVIEEAHREGVKLLITVDCGTTSFDELNLAKRLGIQTIVVDHHELLGGQRPPCSAFLNPLEPGCGTPTRALASVGVAFTFVRGLLEGSGAEDLWKHLDLVALGTVADLAPLTGENRILVKRGLHRLGGTDKPGLRALINQLRLDSQALTTEEISFYLAPCLNAMGRMGSADVSLQLLLTEDPKEAAALAKTMVSQNRMRSGVEREALRRALLKVEREINFSTDRVIVLEDERWHPGVAGILAGRLARRFHRPAVVIAITGSIGRGSARSIGGFPLVDALEEVKEHLLEFGGHPAAAGLTLARDQIAPFRQAFNRVAHRRIDPAALMPSLQADEEMPLSALTEGVLRDLEVLAPFGMGNPRPIFLSRDARLSSGARPTGFDVRGIRLTLEDPQGRPFEALKPRQELDEWNLRALRGGRIHLAYSPQRRPCRAGLEIELKLHDIHLP